MADSTRKTANILPDLNISTSSMGGINYVKINSYTIRAYGTMTGYSQCISSIGITLQAGTYFVKAYSTLSSSIFKAQLRSQSGQTTYATDNSFTLTETTTVYPRIVTLGSYSTETDEQVSIMLNEGATPQPPEPYWQHSLQKLTTTGWQDANVKEWDGSQWS